MNVNIPLSDFESRLETSEVLEKELEARLGKAEEEVQALKTADGGKLTHPISLPRLFHRTRAAQPVQIVFRRS